MPTKTKKPVRPELILGIIAAICAIVFAAMILLCIPYFSPEDSPAIESPGHEDPLSLRQTELPPEIPEDSELAMLQTPPPPLPNPYEKTDFQYDGLFLKNLYAHSRVGIDVSAHQGKIDWQKVKEAGVEFAFIRVGYRGYGQAGKLVADEYAPANLKGAREAGLDVGVYFFSQAINTDEAEICIWVHNPQDIPTLVHELTHAMQFALYDRCYVDHREAELPAYYMEFLTNEFINNIGETCQCQH
jgi:hypothetical protein